MAIILDQSTKTAVNAALNKILPDLANNFITANASSGGHTVNDVDQLTEATLNGGGVFDKLMQAAKTHIQEEYDNGRVTGADYATMYLGAMQYAMQNAVVFLLQWDKRELEKLNLLSTVLNTLTQQEILDAQRAVAEQQVVTEAAKTNDSVDSTTLMADVPVAPTGVIAGTVGRQNTLLESQNDETENQSKLITAQITQTENQADLLLAQKSEVEKEALLTASKTTQMDQQALLTAAQTAQSEKQTTLIEAQAKETDSQSLLINAQTTQSEKQALLLTAQASQSEKQALLLNAQTTQSEKQALLLTAQASKTDQETILVDAQAKETDQQTLLRKEQTAQAVKQSELLASQAELVKQKVMTEARNIMSNAKLAEPTYPVGTALKPTNTDEGSLDATDKLRTNQAEALVNNSLQGVLKLYTDGGIGFASSNDPNGVAAWKSAGFEESNIQDIMDTLKTNLKAVHPKP